MAQYRLQHGGHKRRRAREAALVGDRAFVGEANGEVVKAQVAEHGARHIKAVALNVEVSAVAEHADLAAGLQGGDVALRQHDRGAAGDAAREDAAAIDVRGVADDAAPAGRRGADEAARWHQLSPPLVASW